MEKWKHSSNHSQTRQYAKVVVSLTPLLLYPQERTPALSLDGRVGGSGHFGWETNLFPLSQSSHNPLSFSPYPSRHSNWVVQVKSVDIHKENAHMYPSGPVNISALRPLSDVFIFFRAVFFVALRFHFLLSAIYSAVKEREINQLQVSFSSFFQTVQCVCIFRWLWIMHFH